MTQSDTIGEGWRDASELDRINLLVDLNHAKAAFQLRTIMAVLGVNPDTATPASAQHLTDAPYPGRGHSTSPRTSSE